MKNYTNQLLETSRKEKYHLETLFIDNIWGTDLADLQLLSKFIKGICFLFYAINIYSKYTWVIPLTLIWVGFLGVCFEVEGGGGKVPPPQSKTC